jgi:hypothetical protein
LSPNPTFRKTIETTREITDSFALPGKTATIIPNVAEPQKRGLQEDMFALTQQIFRYLVMFRRKTRYDKNMVYDKKMVKR